MGTHVCELSPGTVLLGDAAHATAPFMGQGANMAMHDAYCLGQILLNPKLSLPAGLQLYQDIRFARVWFQILTMALEKTGAWFHGNQYAGFKYQGWWKASGNVAILGSKHAFQGR